MRIVCISDTHTQLNKVVVPDGDILIHAGDLTYRGTFQETSKELFELSKHRNRFKSIILVEGNHDWLGERDPHLMDQLCKDNGITLLRDSVAIVEGIPIYGSPYQPEFCNWAFNLPRGKTLKEKWDKIPDNTQVLVTHGPPMGILDGVVRFDPMTAEQTVENVGCWDLYNRIVDLKELKLHAMGHIHSGYGQNIKYGIKFVNASICTEGYRPENQPIVIEI